MEQILRVVSDADPTTYVFFNTETRRHRDTERFSTQRKAEINREKQR